jgi:hypothetical protein
MFSMFSAPRLVGVSLVNWHWVPPRRQWLLGLKVAAQRCAAQLVKVSNDS